LPGNSTRPPCLLASGREPRPGQRKRRGHRRDLPAARASRPTGERPPTLRKKAGEGGLHRLKVSTGLSATSGWLLPLAPMPSQPEGGEGAYRSVVELGKILGSTSLYIVRGSGISTARSESPAQPFAARLAGVPAVRSGIRRTGQNDTGHRLSYPHDSTSGAVRTAGSVDQAPGYRTNIQRLIHSEPCLTSSGLLMVGAG
jgi:hypothetical protein